LLNKWQREQEREYYEEQQFMEEERWFMGER
jgi:hypothetical protein